MADQSLCNESYKQKYVVVSRKPGQVVLRPKDESLLDKYWKEFVSAEIPVPPSSIVQLRISSVPKPVRVLDAYMAYDMEYPSVIVSAGGTETDVSKYVTANKPDSQTPGLYRIEYVLPLPGVAENVIWQSYLSIEEPPVLRHIITPWNRESYTIATLNRLVLEPQFQEALYEEGAPFYNFVTSNASPALRPGGAWECRGCAGYKSKGCLFISGRKLPLATSVELDPGPGSSFEVHLDRTVSASAWDQISYAKGSVVQQNKKIYCAIADVSKDDLPGASSKWLEGYLYSLQESVPPTGVTPGTPEYEATTYYKWMSAAEGSVELLAVWAPVDLRGYIFTVDIKHAPQLGTYWGYYNRKYFKDYRPGDLVSYVSDNVLYVYRRNETDIRDLSTEEAYRPGSYQNPHWDEVYASWEGSQLRELGKWIRPSSNAGNAVVAKTCSLSEEMCATFAYILGIPDALVDAIGSKCSVFLYVLLQRTRNTYEGFRNAFKAIGLDVSDLYRVYPTVSSEGEYGESFDAVYAAEDALKRIAVALHYDLLWQKDSDPTPADMQYAEQCSLDAYPDRDHRLYWVRYLPGDPDEIGHSGYVIQEYRGAAWHVSYKITGFGDAETVLAGGTIQGNNRYYRATLSLLDRLASQALVDMGDGNQWIDLGAFSEPSYWVTSLLRYEVPIYIYLVLKTRLASIDEVWYAGRMMRRVHLAAYGGTPTLVVHPSRYFDLATLSVKEVLASVQVLDDTWVDVAPSEMREGSAVYDFDKSVTVRLRLAGEVEVEGYWTSRYTMGKLGDASHDASEMSAGEELYLVNGIVGITPILSSSMLTGELSYLAYNYILSDDGSPWRLDETTPFGSYKQAEGLAVFASWMGPLTSFVDTVVRVTNKDGQPVRYTLQAVGAKVQLEVFGKCPEEIYIYGGRDSLMALIRLPKALPYQVDPRDAQGSDGERATVKILLSKE